jgi:hypothetical protein
MKMQGSGQKRESAKKKAKCQPWNSKNGSSRHHHHHLIMLLIAPHLQVLLFLAVICVSEVFLVTNIVKKGQANIENAEKSWLDLEYGLMEMMVRQRTVGGTKCSCGRNALLKCISCPVNHALCEECVKTGYNPETCALINADGRQYHLAETGMVYVRMHGWEYGDPATPESLIQKGYFPGSPCRPSK